MGKLRKDDDKLKSEEKYTNMLLAAFMIFILPIILILTGAFVGGLIGEYMQTSIKICQIIGGMIGVVLSAIIIKGFDKNSKSDKKADKIYWDDL